MPDCDYCGESFDSEEAEKDHLRSEHADELGPIDRRRVGLEEEGSDFPTGPVALGGVIVAALAIVAYVIFFASSGGPGGTDAAQQPYNYGAVHYHGTMNATIDGQTLDFSRDRYQLQDDAFHYEDGDGSQWHVHAQGVTLQYGLGTLGIEIAGDGSTLTFGGTTYDDSDPDTTVVHQVNGETIDPGSYVLQRGDSVRVVVRTGG
jgi:hypothetical protein